ncbi:hypothetical protein DFJ73DRAFT_329068 [Zopfochytrium polystomum]|nr:hypothetical protein DFJ73DRAFT_329068 [Zopfochytrium polystomum]
MKVPVLVNFVNEKCDCFNLDVKIEDTMSLPRALDQVNQCVEKLLSKTVKKLRQRYRRVQLIDLDSKIFAARMIVVGETVCAGIIGACPIPFADLALLVPAQLGIVTSVVGVFVLSATNDVFKAWKCSLRPC